MTRSRNQRRPGDDRPALRTLRVFTGIVLLAAAGLCAYLLPAGTGRESVFVEQVLFAVGALVSVVAATFLLAL